MHARVHISIEEIDATGTRSTIIPVLTAQWMRDGSLVAVPAGRPSNRQLRLIERLFPVMREQLEAMLEDSVPDPEAF